MRYLILFFALLFSSCAPSRFVEPIPKDSFLINGTLGGPAIGFAGTVIPMPLSSIAVGYGVTDNTVAFGGLHTTALLFNVLQLEAGTSLPLTTFSSHHHLRITPILNGAIDFREGHPKLWPQLDINWVYTWGQGRSQINGYYQPNYFYAGLTNWFELASKRAHGEPQEHHWIPGIQAGHTWRTRNWDYTAEVKYLGLGIANTPNPVDYKGIGGNGALGIYFSLSYFIQPPSTGDNPLNN